MTTRIVIPDVELTWMGSWSASTSYLPNSVVERDGSSYSTKVASTGQDPLLGAPWELVAAKGETGPQGPQGPAGSGAVVYEHIQFAAASTWTINHNQNLRLVDWVVFDSAGIPWEPDVTNPSLNTTIIDLGPISFAGSAYLTFL